MVKCGSMLSGLSQLAFKGGKQDGLAGTGSRVVCKAAWKWVTICFKLGITFTKTAARPHSHQAGPASGGQALAERNHRSQKEGRKAFVSKVYKSITRQNIRLL